MTSGQKQSGHSLRGRRLVFLRTFAFIRVALLLDRLHGEEFVRVNVVQPDPNTHRKSRTQVQGPGKQLSGVGQLRRVQAIERAMVTALVLFFGCVRTEARVARLLAPQHPVNQVAQRWRLGPLAV